LANIPKLRLNAQLPQPCLKLRRPLPFLVTLLLGLRGPLPFSFALPMHVTKTHKRLPIRREDAQLFAARIEANAQAWADLPVHFINRSQPLALPLETRQVIALRVGLTGQSHINP
jgi:hypothetical protein